MTTQVKTNARMSCLAAVLITLLFADAGVGARAAPPRTVLDYYLLLPFGYFGGLGTDSRAERLRLVQDRKGSFVDLRNGYLHVAGDGAQTDLNLCIFRRPDRTYLLAVNVNEASDGVWEPSLDFYVYQHGHLVQVTRSTLPHRFSKRLGYRLPHYGTTINVIDQTGRRIYDLVWAGGRFRVKRAGEHAGGSRESILSPHGFNSYASAGNYPSPDRRYIARVTHEEGDVLNLVVVNARSREALVQAEDVHGFLWLPGRPHGFVVAACGIYGKALLALWEGGVHWQRLRRVRRPNDECFELHGVTRDGRSLIYRYTQDIDRDLRSFQRLHRLRLPAR